MPLADSEDARIYYDDRGAGEPAILCLPGWCVHHTIFAPAAERLSARHRVLAMDWRGHGRSPASDRDWGHVDMLADALAVIRATGVQSVIPLTQAHAGWIAILLQEWLGGRVPKMIFASWNPILASGNPLTPPFLAAMQVLQNEARWREAVEQLVTMWLRGRPPRWRSRCARRQVATDLRIGHEGHARSLRRMPSAAADSPRTSRSATALTRAVALNP